MASTRLLGLALVAAATTYAAIAWLLVASLEEGGSCPEPLVILV